MNYAQEIWNEWWAAAAKKKTNEKKAASNKYDTWTTYFRINGLGHNKWLLVRVSKWESLDKRSAAECGHTFAGHRMLNAEGLMDGVKTS